MGVALLGSSWPIASKYAIRPLRTTMATAPGKLLASICRDRAGAIRARRSLESPTSSGLAVGSACVTRGNSRRRTPISGAMRLRMDDLRGERGTTLRGLFVEELSHALHDLVLGIERVQRARPGERVAGEESLVENLAAPEGAAHDVPRQTEELHPVAGGRRIGREVLLDVRRDGTSEVRFARHDHEAAGAEQLQDLRHARIGRHEE